MKKNIYVIVILIFMCICMKYTFNKSEISNTFLGVPYEDLAELRKTIDNEKLIEGVIVDEIQFEESELVYDKILDEYFITVGENLKGNFYTNKDIELYWVEKNIDDITIDITMEEIISRNEPLELFCYSKGEYQILNIKMTTLPIVKIKSEVMPVVIDNEKIYEKGSITIVESENKETLAYKEKTYNMEYRLRGDLSLKFDKKSFKVQLFNEEDKTSKSLFGFRKDDDWNLGACYSDYSLIREAVVLSLLNEVSQLSENPNIHPQKMVFCELFINDEYWGVYEFLEPMDTKQTQVNKDVDVVYKSTYGKILDVDILRSYNELDEDYENLKIEYYPPQDKDTRYDKMIDFTEFYYSGTYTYEELCKFVNMENFIDTNIAKMTLALMDNDIKNLLYCFEMQEDGSFQVRKEYYDFNFALGDGYSDETYNNTDDYDSSIILFMNLFKDNLTDYELYIKDYVDRYLFLRSEVYSNKNIIATIDKYYNEIVKSGGNIRNAIRWELEVDYEYEHERLIKFVNDHMEEVDKYIENLRELYEV